MATLFLIRNSTTNIIELTYDFHVNLSPPLEAISIDDQQFRDNMLGSIFTDVNNYKPRPRGVDSEGNSYYESDGTDWQDIRTEDEVWRMVRLRRNIELLESDWTQLGDSPLDAPELAQWNSYRSKLRALPNNNADPRVAETQLKNLLDGNDEDGNNPGQGKPDTARESTIPLMIRTLP